MARPPSVLRRLAGALVVPLVAAVAAQSAGNLLFHAAVGRWLPADGYGALGAVLAAMVMLGVPLGALQAAASAGVAGRPASRGTALRILRNVGLISALPGGAVLAAAPALRAYFHLGSTFDAAILAPYLVVAALLAAARGLLLGYGQIGAVATSYVLGTGVRLLIGLALTSGYGISGALAGTLAGELASLALVAWPLLLGPAGDGVPGSLRLATVGRAAVAVTGLFLFSTVDLLLARHHLRGADSGAYVAAATVAKTVLALPAAIMSAVFPRLVTAWGDRRPAPALAAGAAVVVGPALVAGAVVLAAPGTLLRLLYGGGFPEATALVQMLGGIAALTSVVMLVTYAALARRAATIALPWIGALIEILLIELRHDTATHIVLGSAAALVPTLLLLGAIELVAWRRGPRQNAQFAPLHADHMDTSTGLAPAR